MRFHDRPYGDSIETLVPESLSHNWNARGETQSTLFGDRFQKAVAKTIMPLRLFSK